ncbi:MAG: ABC transporter ATP-binding protein [Treponema sp.]|jgi:oligopeptide/dipeptide ABC transporter ATP-binding protein|nr:ABC transporter ATP-binding protein [Treponema sp.]
MNAELLSIRNLNIHFISRARIQPAAPKNGNFAASQVHAVRGLDLSICKGELHALVGESGSGKTASATAIMGLLPSPQAEISGGEILFKGQNLLGLSQEKIRELRGTEISMIFQEPSRYLNPAFKIGNQVEEVIALHIKNLKKKERRDLCLMILRNMGLSDPLRVSMSYPHELSGGMKQRVMIAMATACNPSLLIADEPTTALDLPIQIQILQLIMNIRDSHSMGILFISHNLNLVKDISDTVSVIYAGRIVETAGKEDFFSRPLHPYSVLLLGSIPDIQKRGQRLSVIGGKAPTPGLFPQGCAFHPRCPLAEETCSRLEPELKDSNGFWEKSYGGQKKAHLIACHRRVVS